MTESNDEIAYPDEFVQKVLARSRFATVREQMMWGFEQGVKAERDRLATKRTEGATS